MHNRALTVASEGLSSISCTIWEHGYVGVCDESFRQSSHDGEMNPKCYFMLVRADYTSGILSAFKAPLPPLWSCPLHCRQRWFDNRRNLLTVPGWDRELFMHEIFHCSSPCWRMFSGGEGFPAGVVCTPFLESLPRQWWPSDWASPWTAGVMQLRMSSQALCTGWKRTGASFCL